MPPSPVPSSTPPNSPQLFQTGIQTRKGSDEGIEQKRVGINHPLTRQRGGDGCVISVTDGKVKKKEARREISVAQLGRGSNDNVARVLRLVTFGCWIFLFFVCVAPARSVCVCAPKACEKYAKRMQKVCQKVCQKKRSETGIKKVSRV